MSLTAPVPVSADAWMGYRSVAPLTVAVCSWCSDAAEVDAWCRANGVEVSHGLCRRCAAVQMAQLTGERVED